MSDSKYPLTYYSESRNEYVKIEDMADRHLFNAYMRIIRSEEKMADEVDGLLAHYMLCELRERGVNPTTGVRDE